MKKLIHQDSRTANLHWFTSKTDPLLPKPFLCFPISWGDLATITLIIVMVRFTLNSFHLNIPHIYGRKRLLFSMSLFIIVYITLLTQYNQMPLNFMLVFKRLHLKLLNILTFLTLRVVLGYQPTRLKQIYTIFKYKFVKFNPQRNRNIVVPTVCELSKYNLSRIIHQRFGRVSITRIKQMEIKLLMKSLPTNLTDLKDTCPIFYLTKATNISIGPTIDVSKVSPLFMLQMFFSFFNVEII